jgi:hypothetical protein
VEVVDVEDDGETGEEEGRGLKHTLERLIETGN